MPSSISCLSTRRCITSAVAIGAVVFAGCNESPTNEGDGPGKYVLTVSRSDPVAGSDVEIVAQLVDNSGDPVPVTGRRVSWTVNAGGGAFSTPTSVTDVDGTASVRFATSTVAGVSYVITATDEREVAGASAPITSLPDAAAVLSFTAQPSVTGANAVIAPVRVQVRDRFGNAAVAAVTVSLGANASNALLAGSTSAGAVGGVATFNNLRVNNTGSYTLVASVTGAPSVASADFSILLPFTQIAAGHNHTCALTPDGAAYCWGTNGNAQVGDGTVVDRPTPTPVVGGQVFTSIVSGGLHSCGLTANGSAYCWGANNDGQIGDGNTGGGTVGISAFAPTAVLGGLTFTRLTAGFLHTCGLRSSGAVYCWGDNLYSQLGDGTTIARTTPTLVGGGQSFSSISAGSWSTCALTNAGATFCWGYNLGGELGDGTNGNKSSPVVVAVGFAFASIANGSQHRCGLTSAGLAYCWGYGADGQLGDGANLLRVIPVPVAGGQTYVSVATSWSSCAVTTGGTARCWGFNNMGQLGDGTVVPTNVPVTVIGNLSFTAISAGLMHSCALTSTRLVYCWGLNDGGQVGDGTVINRSAPTLLKYP